MLIHIHFDKIYSSFLLLLLRCFFFVAPQNANVPNHTYLKMVFIACAHNKPPNFLFIYSQIQAKKNALNEMLWTNSIKIHAKQCEKLLILYL